MTIQNWTYYYPKGTAKYEEIRERIKKSKLGKPRPDITGEKAILNRLRKENPEKFNKIMKSLHTPETARKIALSKKGKPRPDISGENALLNKMKRESPERFEAFMTNVHRTPGSNNKLEQQLDALIKENNLPFIRNYGNKKVIKISNSIPDFISTEKRGIIEVRKELRPWYKARRKAIYRMNEFYSLFLSGKDFMSENWKENILLKINIFMRGLEK